MVTRATKLKKANLLTLNDPEGLDGASTLDLVDRITHDLDSKRIKYSIKWDGHTDSDAIITAKIGKNTVEWRHENGVSSVFLNSDVIITMLTSTSHPHEQSLVAYGFLSLALSLK